MTIRLFCDILSYQKEGRTIMKEQDCNRHFMKHMIQILHILQMNQVGIEQILEDSGQSDVISEVQKQSLRTACGVMDEMPGGIVIYRADESQSILYANQGLLRIFQCDTLKDFLEFTDHSFRGMVHPEDLEAVEDEIQAQIQDGKEQQNHVEYRIFRKDGSIRWIENYGRFIHCEDAGDIFYVFVGDATDKRKHRQSEQERQLEEARNKANTAVIAKNTFLTNISHDIRTPINAIFGFTSLAKSSLHDPGVLESYLERIENASKKLLDMLTKVLEVTALSSSEELREVECDLYTISQEVYDFLRPHAEEKNISYSLDCSGIRHSSIIADQEKLRQMMLNLVNNAVTYTKPGGNVTVKITEGDELIDQEALYCMTVEDTGIGMSEEFINHIFEPFSREKNSTLSGVHSIGLGLTIVKSIVDIMGGTIDAKSVENQGSTFIVTLRFRILSLDDETQTQVLPQPRRKILLVEDNEINREIEAELLERMDFIVDPAEDGQVALEKMRQASPGDYDLILLDLMMPVMDGWQTAAAIRSLPNPELANIPIIALSASVFVDDYRKSKESGINVHLAKPLNLPVLMDTIEELTKEKS